MLYLPKRRSYTTVLVPPVGQTALRRLRARLNGGLVGRKPGRWTRSVHLGGQVATLGQGNDLVSAAQGSRRSDCAVAVKRRLWVAFDYVVGERGVGPRCLSPLLRPHSGLIKCLLTFLQY